MNITRNTINELREAVRVYDADPIDIRGTLKLAKEAELVDLAAYIGWILNQDKSYAEKLALYTHLVERAIV